MRVTAPVGKPLTLPLNPNASSPAACATGVGRPAVSRAAAAKSGQVVVVDDVQKDSRYLSGSTMVKSEIVVPIIVNKLVAELDILPDRLHRLWLRITAPIPAGPGVASMSRN